MAISCLTGDASGADIQAEVISVYKTHIHNVLLKQGIVTVEENDNFAEYVKLLKAITSLVVNKEDLDLDLTELDELTTTESVVDIIKQVDPEIDYVFITTVVIKVDDYLMQYLKENHTLNFYVEEVALIGKRRFGMLKNCFGFSTTECYTKDILRCLNYFGYDIKTVWGVIRPYIETCDDVKLMAYQLLIAVGGSSLSTDSLLLTTMELIDSLDIVITVRIQLTNYVKKELETIMATEKNNVN